jgi:tRNA 2-thiocytidine biosynthesis protein TtcA
MKASYTNRDGDIRIIRPLAYVRETMTSAFAQAAKLPVIPDSCPACFSMPTQREQTKQLLRQLEKKNRNLFPNMLHAMRPLLTENFD